ncbi:UDP-glucuronic acid decarboxylase family protein [Rhizosaccharibacter radicis]|uniref:SDR family oxidoreductase n=1 Tax=Rhizosaccharibacter radicis TaxID=2782605 RepID=A0ABT1W055_9PROT|nr:SDR family oxidoreductase [Acetobacteraceae bacterium KSS12]
MHDIGGDSGSDFGRRDFGRRPRVLRVLVTGGAGFLGSHLCDRLLADGQEVICLDNLSSGRTENIAHLDRDARFRFVEHDVCEPVPASLLHDGLDRIYNLASPASPPHYQIDPIQTTRTSVLGALNTLAAARHTGARILQASTSEIYGDPTVHPQPETYLGNVNPIGPRACYDEGKRCAETLFFDHRRMHDTIIKVVRIFNTHGPRMHPEDGRVVSNFIGQALRGEDITLYGDGSQTRAFCFVSDLIEGFVRMMDTAPDRCGPVNLGNPHEISVRTLAERILALTGSRSRLVFRQLPQDDPTQRCPDIGRAQEWLGWEPLVGLDEGLRQTIAHFRRLFGIAPLGDASLAMPASAS